MHLKQVSKIMQNKPILKSDFVAYIPIGVQYRGLLSPLQVTKGFIERYMTEPASSQPITIQEL